jgi:hypothetical protein
MPRMRDIQWRFILFPFFVGLTGIVIFLWTHETDDVTYAKITNPTAMNKAGPIKERETPIKEKETPLEPIQKRTPSSTDALTALALKATKKVEQISESKTDLMPSLPPQVCTSLEYPGDSPDLLSVAPKDWALVMKEFHWAKAKLLHWIDQNGKALPQTTLSPLVALVKNIRIQRPPATDEPDLSWRGIGVKTNEESGAPIIRVGAGFFSLVKNNQERARFEMVRLVAQVWSPCDLKLIGMPLTPWKGFLSCMGFEEFLACKEGGFSEPGWAVSTALAHILSPLKCEIPAFQGAPYQDCLMHFSVKQEVAQR